MFERFTEKAIKVVTASQESAKRLNHSALYPEHLLVGILQQKSGIASKFLKAAGLNAQSVEQEIKKRLKNIETAQQQEFLPFSDTLKTVLKRTWDKSRKLKTHYIIPEHLFLSIVSYESSNVIEILSDFEVDIERIKESVRKIISKNINSRIHPETLNKPCTGAGCLPRAYQSIPSIFEEASSISLMNSATHTMKESKYEVLGTEHIMQALFEKAGESLVEIFDGENIDKNDFLEQLSQTQDRSDEFDGECLYTPKAYRSITSAYEIAKELGSSSILPEHIMLGILRQKSGITYNALVKMGIDTNRLYEKILKPIEKQKPVTMTIIRLAKEEARRLGHSTLGSELLLLGIIDEGTTLGAQVLLELGINIKDARKAVEHLIGYGDEYLGSQIELSSRANRIIDFACKEAKRYNEAFIHSEHLLLGIINEKGCIANKVLEMLGVDAIEIKQGILNKI